MAFKSLTRFQHSLGVGAIALDCDQLDGEAKARILLHVVEGYVDGLRGHVIAHLIYIHWIGAVEREDERSAS